MSNSVENTYQILVEIKRRLMIDIAQLRKDDIGSWVLYSVLHGATEKGRIKSWNDKFIFVVYRCAGEWDKYQNYTGCATKPEDLRFTTLSEVI